jgi:hypothetical protein
MEGIIGTTELSVSCAGGSGGWPINEDAKATVEQVASTMKYPIKRRAGMADSPEKNTGPVGLIQIIGKAGKRQETVSLPGFIQIFYI